MMNVSASLAEFDRSLIVERCRAGRREARLKGKKFGRPKGLPSARVDSCCALYKAGRPIEDIRLAFGINPVYFSQKKESE
jgi:DNA invertase Pin-like site-specific DNA recombinase